MEDIGPRIKKLREKHGYSLRGLGERINMTHSHLSRIEKGEKIPNIELLETLANVFDVPISYFFGETIEIPPELENMNIEWIAFNEKMDKKGLTPEEIEKIIDFVEYLRKKD